MGNYVSSRRTSEYRTADCKVVLPDGSTVHTFPRGTSVAELMLEHPQHCVVELRSLMAGSGIKSQPLPADHKLDPKGVYLMLPMRQGKAVPLPAAEARRLLLRTRSVLRPGSFLPPSAYPSSSNSSPRAAKKKRRPACGRDVFQDEERKVEGPVFPAEALAEMQGFLNRQLSGSGRGWKPRLQTIEENALQTKVPHWLL